MSFGILASFIGATLQASNYAVTQRCQQQYNLRGVNLLVAVHIAMGVLSLCISLAFGYLPLLKLSHWIEFVKINLPYLVAQYALIQAIQKSDASIVSPLLAIKVPVLAVIALLLGSEGFAVIQWLSISAIIALAFYFSTLSGRIHLEPLLLVIIASTGYCLSDMAITQFSHQIIDSDAMTQSLVTICLNYTVCGLFSLLLMKPLQVSFTDAYHSKWVALTWFVGVIFLILGFNLAGVVSGNIIQTLRGVIGVLIAFIWFRHQSSLSILTWKKKIITSILMILAVGLFYL